MVDPNTPYSRVQCTAAHHKTHNIYCGTLHLEKGVMHVVLWCIGSLLIMNNAAHISTCHNVR